MVVETIDINSIIYAIITAIAGYFGGQYQSNKNLDAATTNARIEGQQTGYKTGIKLGEAQATQKSIAGNISSEGLVIGEADVDLVKHYAKDGYKDETSLSPISKTDIPEIGIKLTTIKDGKVVIGYSLDSKDVRVIGNTDMTTVNGMPKTKTMYTRFSQYTSDMWIGEHTIKILQGYVDGKTAIGADNIIWFKSNEFKVQMLE